MNLTIALYQETQTSIESLETDWCDGRITEGVRGDPDIVNAVFSLSQELDDILATRIFPGSCRICNKIAIARATEGRW